MVIIFPDLDQPAVTVSPTSPKEGDNITFTCSGTSNDGTMAYTWYHNDALISGATSQTYILRNAQKTTNNGNYHCTIKTTAFTKVSAKKNLALRCEFNRIINMFFFLYSI